jgi:NADH-quinone oxidoreductase subunit I
MGITMKRFFKKKVTQQYPEVKPNLPPRSHGSFVFEFDKCISCNMCADACPNGVIRVDFTKNEKGRRVLDQYNMNLGYCLFCGFCTKACPTDAIQFQTDFDSICYNKEDTIRRWKKSAGESVVAEVEIKTEAAATIEKAVATSGESKIQQEGKEE